MRRVCWWIKDVSTYDPPIIRKRTDLHIFHHGIPKVQGDYKRLIYLYSLTIQTLTMIRLEKDYTTLERTTKLSR
jgi:hypothetical protein